MVSLYFVRSGDVHMDQGFSREAGLVDYYWSGSGADSDGSYYLAGNDLGISPSTGPHGRYLGFSLRCLQE